MLWKYALTPAVNERVQTTPSGFAITIIADLRNPFSQAVQPRELVLYKASSEVARFNVSGPCTLYVDDGFDGAWLKATAIEDVVPVACIVGTEPGDYPPEQLPLTPDGWRVLGAVKVVASSASVAAAAVNVLASASSVLQPFTVGEPASYFIQNLGPDDIWAAPDASSATAANSFIVHKNGGEFSVQSGTGKLAVRIVTGGADQTSPLNTRYQVLPL